MRSALLAVALAGVLGGAGTATAVVLVRQGEALPGTTVSGIDVSGLGAADIERALAGTEREVEAGSLTLVRAGERRPVARADLGVDVDLASTAAQAVRAGRGSVLSPLLAPLRGAERAVPLTVAIDEQQVARSLAAVAADLAREPDPGGFSIEGTTVTVQAPVAGLRLDTEGATTAVLRALQTAGADEVVLPVVTLPPPVTAERIEAVAAAARRALQTPYRLSAGELVVEVPPTQLATALSGVHEAGAFDLTVDQPLLTKVVDRLLAPIQRPGRAATFAVEGRPPTFDVKGSTSWTPRPAVVTVVPGVVGRRIDVDVAVQHLTDLVYGVDREGVLPVDVSEPDLTTAQAKAAGVSRLVSTFTTYYQPGQPRVTNIRRIAAIVDGTYLAPGEEFSLNGTAGRRTKANGFVEDGAILDGELVQQVGGGVSQFATTLFNAAYFAGVPIPAHKPHSFYISRYPPGRESTVNFPTLDVRFVNDTAHGLLVRTASTPTSVTVSLYGDNGGRRVQSTTGDRRPRDDGGFSILVTRQVSGGDGKGGRRVFTTYYNPAPEH